MTPDITALFNKFAGQEIPMHMAYNGETKKIIHCHVLNTPEPVFEEMKKVAQDNALELHICHPLETLLDREAKANRVTAYIEQRADGKWRISNRFDIG